MGPRLGKDGRTALTVAGSGQIRTGDVVVFLKPVAVAPAVLRRDGRVQADGHPADHARLGLAEERLDELCGSPGVIDEIARQSVLEGKVKGGAAGDDPGAGDPVHAFDDADPGRRFTPR